MSIGIRKIRELHEERSDKAKAIDDSLEAKIAPTAEHWVSNPNRFDIQGVDYFPLPLVKNDFDANLRMFVDRAQDYYGVDLSEVKWFTYTDEDEYYKEYGEVDKNVYAFARKNKKEMHFSPDATKAITKGKIENLIDFSAINTVSHEILHLVGGVPIVMNVYDTLSNGRNIVDEGATEILSNRFTLENIQFDRKIRTEIMGTSKIVGLDPQVGYDRYVRIVSSMALIATDGNPNEAIEWIRKIYLGKYEEKKKAQEDFERGYLKTLTISQKRKYYRDICNFSDHQFEWFSYMDNEENNNDKLMKILKKYWEEGDDERRKEIVRYHPERVRERLSKTRWEGLVGEQRFEVLMGYVNEETGIESESLHSSILTKADYNKIIKVIPSETLDHLSTKGDIYASLMDISRIGTTSSSKLLTKLVKSVVRKKLHRNIPKKPLSIHDIDPDPYWALREGWFNVPTKTREKMRTI